MKRPREYADWLIRHDTVQGNDGAEGKSMHVPQGNTRCILSAMVGWIQRFDQIVIPFLFGLFFLSGCAGAMPDATLPTSTLPAPTSAAPLQPTATSSPSATPTSVFPTLEAIIRAYTATPTPTRVPTPMPLRWDVYDRDPQHPWNRLFRALYGRFTAHVHEYGRDRHVPLVW